MNRLLTIETTVIEAIGRLRKGVSEYVAAKIGRQKKRTVTLEYDAVRARLFSGLREALGETPVESGSRNPAESVIRGVLDLYPRHAPEWMRSLVLGSPEAAIRADVLVCLGRMPRELIAPWGYELARESLQSEDAEVRDAAVRALELWGGPTAIEILQTHLSMCREVPWLADYIGRVVGDLAVR